jgi:hypothetical protein
MNETIFALATVNKDVRFAIGKYFLELFDLKRKVFRLLKKEYQSNFSEKFIRYIMLQDKINEYEIFDFIEKTCPQDIAESYKEEAIKLFNAKGSYVDFIIKTFGNFYKREKFSLIYEKYKDEINVNGDISEFLIELKEIQDIESAHIPVTKLGYLTNEEIEQMIKDAYSTNAAIPSTIECIRNSSPWKGYLKGQICQFVAAPGVGKSFLMLNEAVEAMRHGFKVYWMALGDMMNIDIITRATALITGKSLADVSIDLARHYDDEVRSILKNMRTTVVPAGSLTINTICEFVNSVVDREEKIDLFVLDYDANVAKQLENMYEQGELIYNSLSKISRPTGRTEDNRLVFVASQPKQEVWNNEELEKNSAAESSRKQAVVDMMITMGYNNMIKGYHAGVIKVAKARRGTGGMKNYYRLTKNGKIETITASEYNMMKTFEG